MTVKVDSTLSYNRMSNEPLPEAEIKSCCFCIPVRVGCFILGYLNLIYNAFQTLVLVSFTAFIAVQTHGFDHFDLNDRTDDTKPLIFEDGTDSVELAEAPFLHQFGVLLIIVILFNVGCLLLNIACLVGIHKKSPNHLRVFVFFATGRLILSLCGIIYLIVNRKIGAQSVLTYSIDFGLTAYFLMVYYLYAKQLAREQLASFQPQVENSSCNEIAIIFPAKLDKQNLVH